MRAPRQAGERKTESMRRIDGKNTAQMKQTIFEEAILSKHTGGNATKYFLNKQWDQIYTLCFTFKTKFAVQKESLDRRKRSNETDGSSAPKIVFISNCNWIRFDGCSPLHGAIVIRQLNDTQNAKSREREIEKQRRHLSYTLFGAQAVYFEWKNFTLTVSI